MALRFSPARGAASIVMSTMTRGPTGPGATIEIGTVTTGAAGSDATVTNSGTTGAAVLDFSIPQGDTGLIGEWRGDWVTATAYAVGDAVSNDGSSYICVTAHTSGTFATDLAAGKWEVVAEKGDAATIEVGTVTTGDAGSDATVTNSGTSAAAVLDFSIPKGNQGDAATISVGTVTTGAADSDATVTNSGTAGAAVFDFSIPKGDTGTAATISVGTVTTGDAGTDASVTNSGTSSAAVFDFEIPKGDPGPLAAEVSTDDITGTTYTVVSGDLGKRKRTTNSSAVTITLPNSMAQGFSFLLCQAGAGQVAFSAATGATLHNRPGYSKTAGQWSEVSLTVDTNSDDTSAIWVLSGDVGT